MAPARARTAPIGGAPLVAVATLLPHVSARTVADGTARSGDTIFR